MSVDTNLRVYVQDKFGKLQLFVISYVKQIISFLCYWKPLAILLRANFMDFLILGKSWIRSESGSVAFLASTADVSWSPTAFKALTKSILVMAVVLRMKALFAWLPQQDTAGLLNGPHLHKIAIAAAAPTPSNFYSSLPIKKQNEKTKENLENSERFLISKTSRGQGELRKGAKPTRSL